MDTDKTLLLETAKRQLMTYGIWDGKTRLKRSIKKYLLHREVTPEDVIFWPTGLLAAGLWDWGEHQAVIAYYDRWIEKKMPIVFLDDLLVGETLLALWEETEEGQQKAQYEKALQRMAAYGKQYPTDQRGSFPYRANQKNGYVFVDGIGLACPFLYQYGSRFGQQEYQQLAVRQIENYLAYGMDGKTGLPYHGYDAESGMKYGIIGWGRAVGWLLRGMMGCLGDAKGTDGHLKEAYQTLVDNVLFYQQESGYFTWQLQATEGPVDTSATAMIGTALQQGIRKGILQEDGYQQALEKCRQALEKSIRNGNLYDCSGECEGFAQYPQRYGAYPWALGPGLQVFAAFDTNPACAKSVRRNED